MINEKNSMLKQIEAEIEETKANIAECNSIMAKAEKYGDSDLYYDTREVRCSCKTTLCKLEGLKRRVKLTNCGEFITVDEFTETNDSPVAEVSRLLLDNFEITNTFSCINSGVIGNLINRKLSTPKIHKAVLENFEGVKFRRQNNGYTYTLRRRDTANLKE
jgi:hypothetical protein